MKVSSVGYQREVWWLACRGSQLFHLLSAPVICHWPASYLLIFSLTYERYIFIQENYSSLSKLWFELRFKNSVFDKILNGMFHVQYRVFLKFLKIAQMRDKNMKILDVGYSFPFPPFIWDTLYKWIFLCKVHLRWNMHEKLT